MFTSKNTCISEGKIKVLGKKLKLATPYYIYIFDKFLFIKSFLVISIDLGKWFTLLYINFS